MAHYPSSFTINRLRLAAHLGYGDAERANRQPVEIALRFYFSKPPACAADDHAHFLAYDAVCALLSDAVEKRTFRLIEFMAQELFDLVRRSMDAHGAADAALWLKLTKCQPAVDHLQDGAAYVLSDLPAHATVVEVA